MSRRQLTPDDLRPFPMQNGPPIPWFLAESIYRHLYRFSGQTLERLGQRGGFSWGEVGALYKDNSSRDQRAACRAEVWDNLKAASETATSEGT